MKTVMNQPIDKKLSVRELAEAMYEGTQHVQNLAEKLARQHSGAGALSFFGMMGDDVQNFWMGIAEQIIEHSKGWKPNQSGSCEMKKDEAKRLRELPRVADQS